MAAKAAEQKDQKGGKKRKHVFAYGNYRYYYGYRIGNEINEDPRLKVLKKEWFEDKDCLDIGCNQGLVTISIARNFHCRSILGVDIDNSLIETAKWNIRKILRNEAVSSKSLDISASKVLNEECDCEQEVSKFPVKEFKLQKCTSVHNDVDLLKRVSFRRENFVEKFDNCSGIYDTITCFSVTKWIHLNWGDDGLVTLFAKVWKLLRPGGIFLLEPQPWKSYEKNRRISETTKQNFDKIFFTPDLFEEILLDKIGFRSVENVTASISGTVAGFDRPIFVFRK